MTLPPLFRMLLIHIFPGVLLLALTAAAFPANGVLPFSRGILERQKQEIGRLKTQLAQTIQTNRELAAELSPMQSLRIAGMMDSAKAQDQLRENLERVGGKTGLQFRTLGECRKSSPAERVSLYEMTFSADGSLGEFAAFCSALAADKQALYWRSISVRNATPASGDDMLSISGTVCMIAFPGDEL